MIIIYITTVAVFSQLFSKVTAEGKKLLQSWSGELWGTCQMRTVQRDDVPCPLSSPWAVKILDRGREAARIMHSAVFSTLHSGLVLVGGISKLKLWWSCTGQTRWLQCIITKEISGSSIICLEDPGPVSQEALSICRGQLAQLGQFGAEGLGDNGIKHWDEKDKSDPWISPGMIQVLQDVRRCQGHGHSTLKHEVNYQLCSQKVVFLLKHQQFNPKTC